MFFLIEAQKICLKSLLEKNKIVLGASFSLKEGESMAIMGPSGSGKTTFALSLLGLQSKKIEVKGEIYFLNKNLSQMGYREKKKLLGSEISMLMQDPSCSLNPFFSLGFHFYELLRKNKNLNNRAKKEKIGGALVEVGLKDKDYFLKAYPHQLSGGEKQRALIAMALINEPKLLIADEPTASLDLVIKVEILKLIQSLQSKKGFSLILITHDPLVAKKMCSKIYLIENQRLVLRK